MGFSSTGFSTAWGASVTSPFVSMMTEPSLKATDLRCFCSTCSIKLERKSGRKKKKKVVCYKRKTKAVRKKWRMRGNVVVPEGSEL